MKIIDGLATSSTLRVIPLMHSPMASTPLNPSPHPQIAAANFCKSFQSSNINKPPIKIL
jgi:hypothetical protein